MFPPYNWEGVGTFVDSYVIQNANVISAVKQCRDLGFDDANITADVLLLGNMRNFTEYTPAEGEEEFDKTTTNFMRSLAIHNRYSNSNEIFSNIRAYPNVHWRYLLQQTEANSGMGLISFNHDQIMAQIANGKALAQQVVQLETYQNIIPEDPRDFSEEEAAALI